MIKNLLITVFIFLYSINAYAISLFDALNQTYKNNIQLNAERENIKASEEDINISQADYMPSITLSGSKSIENTNKLTNQSGEDVSVDDADPFSTSIKLEQTLLDGTRDFVHKKNIIGLELAKVKLIKKEQEIFYKAIEAYTSIILARENVKINRQNLNLFIKQVENDKVRLNRGLITTADLSQSESSLAGASAQLTKAKSELLINKLNYENIIGKLLNPNELQKSNRAIVGVPDELSSALMLSKINNPDIKIAQIELNQSEIEVSISESDLKPTANLSLERSYSDDFSSTYDQREKDVLKATMSWPFYSGGSKRAKINKNNNLNVRKRLILEDVIKTTEKNVGSAWSNLEASKSFLNSVRAQVKAAKIANEGIAAEYERGSRTTLDVIQSNSLLLSARLSLINSERNYLIAQYNLLKSIGLLNSDYLKIK
tara:strand:- start:65 stop:1357 length:1293 start_codon:yes stop_codon:yes gene_type:complete